MKSIRVILIHGNGNSKPTDIWFPSVKTELEKFGFDVLAPQFPDVKLARASYWLPFLKNELKADENTIIIGHSSGAIAAMRYAEKNKIYGSVLVGSYYTDLGYENEKLSGYFDNSWNWGAIKSNQRWIVQFSSIDDPWIPIEEPRYVHEQLSSEYHEYQDQGHFGGDNNKTSFPEIITAIRTKLRN